jgi:hypothetical protein
MRIGISRAGAFALLRQRAVMAGGAVVARGAEVAGDDNTAAAEATVATADCAYSTHGCSGQGAPVPAATAQL